MRTTVKKKRVDGYYLHQSTFRDFELDRGVRHTPPDDEERLPAVSCAPRSHILPDTRPADGCDWCEKWRGKTNVCLNCGSVLSSRLQQLSLVELQRDAAEERAASSGLDGSIAVLVPSVDSLMSYTQKRKQISTRKRKKGKSRA